MKYAILLVNSDVVVEIPRKILNESFLLEICDESRLKDKVAYWKFIINWDPILLKLYEDLFLINCEKLLEKPKRHRKKLK